MYVPAFSRTKRQLSIVPDRSQRSIPYDVYSGDISSVRCILVRAYGVLCCVVFQGRGWEKQGVGRGGQVAWVSG